MKKIFILIAFVSNFIYSQTFTGKVVNNLEQGLEGKKVEIFFNSDGFNKRFLDWTDALGNFSADSIGTLDVDDTSLLPDGYQISLNYPNPFNPKTIFDFSLPQNSTISVDVFTILGERILSIDKKDYSAGNNKQIIEMNGFSNGVYFSRISIDDKYFVVRKMLLLYGSQHASETQISSNLQLLNKIKTATTNIDSVVITGDAIKKKTITGFPQYTADNIDLGTFTVDSNYVNLTLNVKKLMEWTQPNNQQTNAIVNLSGREAMTDANGQAIFMNIPSGRNTLTITHPEIYTRETILKLENDSTHTEYIIDTTNFTTPMMEVYNDIFGRNWPGFGYQMSRWDQPPIFYIVADTTTEEGRWRANQQIAKIDTILAPAYTTPQYPEGFLKNYQIEVGLNPPPTLTPGYYVIDWQNISPNIGLTGVTSDTTSGKILSARTTYNSLADANTMERITIHELSSGMSAAGRSNTISSVWNISPSQTEKDFTPTDKQMILYQYSRPPGNKITDKDEGF